jgi:hypothetical protein
MIILYSSHLIYDFDEPNIPSLLHIRIKTPSNISRRKTTSKTTRKTTRKNNQKKQPEKKQPEKQPETTI